MKLVKKRVVGKDFEIPPGARLIDVKLVEVTIDEEGKEKDHKYEITFVTE